MNNLVDSDVLLENTKVIFQIESIERNSLKRFKTFDQIFEFEN